MQSIPTELVCRILNFLQYENDIDSGSHTSMAHLACINNTWLAAVESILWSDLIITVYYHRRGHDLDNLQLYTSGHGRLHRRRAIRSLTMRWIKYTSKEEKRDIARLTRNGAEPEERLPIPRKMLHEDILVDFSDDEYGSEAGEPEREIEAKDETTTDDDSETMLPQDPFMSDESDVEEPDDASKNDMCEQLHSAQEGLFERIRNFWEYIASWKSDLFLEVFRIRLVCTSFAREANGILCNDNERYLAFLRADLRESFRLPLLETLCLVDVDGTRDLAYWTDVVGLRILLATPSIVPKLYGGGGPLRILPNRSRPWKMIGKSHVFLQ